MKGRKRVIMLTAIFFILLVSAVLLTFAVPLLQTEEGVTPPEGALYKDATQPVEARVADLLSYMTLEEKIGQMTLVEKNSVHELNDISAYHFGGMLSGSGAKPATNTVEGWHSMIEAFQSQAAQSRLGVPLLYGTDAIHGHAHVPGFTVFPHAIGLGASGDAELVRSVAEVTAAQMKATGANWNFAPNLDLPRDVRWGRTYEAFSDDTKLVSQLGSSYVDGLQNPTRGAGVLATLKHYVGVGSMGWDTSTNKDFKIDQGVTPAEEMLLHEYYLPPFEEALEAGALSVMVGLNTWGDKKMVLQEHLLTGVLKGDLEFKGFVVSDWYGVHEGRKNIFWATVSAVNAGVDMVMLPFDYKTFAWHMKVANRLGLVSDERINDAVGRILYAKFALGLFDKEEVISIDEDTNNDHKSLAQQAVAQTLVLLKNDDVLPIRANVRHMRVSGSAADNIGKQMGAWSIEWQGVDGNEVEGATSILEGIRSRAPLNALVEYDAKGEFTDATIADIGIAVVGEDPYAEGWGDKAYPILSEEDVQAIKNLQATSKKVVVVIVSGRPLLIEHEIDDIDALVAAWLPGSEGAGVADVLFGYKPFTGTLPLPWPLRLEQLPIAPDGSTADGTPVLFPRNFKFTQ